jgi:hypothetical protein
MDSKLPAPPRAFSLWVQFGIQILWASSPMKTPLHALFGMPIHRENALSDGPRIKLVLGILVS